MTGRLRVQLTWHLAILGIAFLSGANPSAAQLRPFFPHPSVWESGQPAKSINLTRVVWKGVETFQDAYAYNGHINPASTVYNEYFHKITIKFTYIDDTDLVGLHHFVSAKISWNLDSKGLAKNAEETTCKGGGEVELVGLSEHDQKERLKAKCNYWRSSVHSYVMYPGVPGAVEPPGLPEWDKLRDNYSYSREAIGHTYSVRVSRMLTCAERAGKPIPEKDPDLLSVDVHINDQNVQITPDGKTKVRIKVTCDNVPVKDAEVEVTVKPMDGSGGHYHDASKRLRGKLNGTDCGDLTNSNYCVKRQTGEDGELTDSKNEKGLTFAPPGKTPRSRCVGLAGVYEVTAKSTRFPDRKAVAVITVKYDNLTLKLVTDTDSGSGIPIDPANPRTIVGSYYKIRSVTDAHPYGPYGTTTTVSAFQGVAKDFYQLQVDHNAVLKQCGHLAGWDPPKKVSFNDIALPGGGLFDLGPSDKDPVHPWWQPGHQTHGKGGGGDFNHFYQTSTLRECNGTDRNFDAWLWSNLKALGKKYGGQWDQDDLNKGNLWHLHIDDAGVKRPEKCPDDD